jgi:hypothetical protein
MRAALILAALAALLLLFGTACDTAPSHPADRCPAPWLPDACPDSSRVPW